jgi:hypothetical protein
LRVILSNETNNLFEFLERLRAIGVTSEHDARAASLRFQLAPEFEAWLEQEQI